VIAVPSAEDLARANAGFDRDWGGVDDVLRELSRDNNADAFAETRRIM